jgi:hypothetical protein
MVLQVYFTSAFFSVVQRATEQPNLTTSITLKNALIALRGLYLMPLGSFAE